MRVMLGDDAHSIFAGRGILRLEQALPPTLVREAQRVVRSALERQGFLSDGVWCFDRMTLPPYPSIGKIGFKKNEAFDALSTSDLIEAVGFLAGDRDLVTMGHQQLLLTFPNADRWSVPSSIWHVDAPRLPSAACPGVQTFIFLEASEHEGGGTLVVAGSHRLLNDGRFIRSKDIKRQLKRFPCFQQLMSANLADRERLLGSIGHVGEVEIEVVEMTGRPGDVWLMDMRVLHNLAPNARSTPRVMLTQRFATKSAFDRIVEGFRPEEPQPAAT